MGKVTSLNSFSEMRALESKLMLKVSAKHGKNKFEKIQLLSPELDPNNNFNDENNNSKINNNNKQDSTVNEHLPAQVVLLIEKGRIGSDKVTRVTKFYADEATARRKYEEHAAAALKGRRRQNFEVNAYKETPYLCEAASDEEQYPNEKRITDEDFEEEVAVEPEVQELLALIVTDFRSTATFAAMKGDLSASVAGPVTDSALLRAKTVLKALMMYIRKRELVREGEPMREWRKQVRNLSSNFYFVIPHFFARSRMPLIDSYERVTEKFQLLTALEEPAYRRELTLGHPRKCRLLIRRLNGSGFRLSPLADGEPLVSSVRKCIDNTGAAPDCSHRVKLERVYKFDETATATQQQPCTLLWHGTNVANVASILAGGLRISCHQTNGNDFGRGLYFADTVHKSAQYCKFDHENRSAGGQRVLLLCEVDTGRTVELCTGSERFVSAPGNFDTVKALGRRIPDERQRFKDENGALLADGELSYVNTGEKRLEYNEYVVYAEKRVKIRYVVVVSSVPFKRSHHTESALN